MKLKVLGCSGGIGGQNRTTCLMLNDNILIDCGTGLADLPIEALEKITHIFITHSHLDHICCLPLLIDTVFGSCPDKVINVYGSEHTVDALKEHVFNWKIWPDFTELPDKQTPILRLHAISMNDVIELDDIKISPTPANHVVPTFGYHVRANKSLVFTGDTSVCDDLWVALNQIDDLAYLIIETAFSDDEIKIAKLSKHLCPSLLIHELEKLKSNPNILITHLKPSDGEKIMKQIQSISSRFNIQAIEPHTELSF